MKNTDSLDRAALAVAVMKAAGVKPSIEKRVKSVPVKWGWATGKSVNVEKVEVYPAYDTAEGFCALWDALEAKGIYPAITSGPSEVLVNFSVVKGGFYVNITRAGNRYAGLVVGAAKVLGVSLSTW